MAVYSNRLNMKSDTYLNKSASKKCHITFQHLSPDAIATDALAILHWQRTMAANSRGRSMSRNFFLLRWADNLRVPTPRNLNAFERTKCAKNVIFSNNSTNEQITEPLLHKFSNHLDANDLPRRAYTIK